MLELFSKVPDALSLADESHLIPIAVEDAVSSLSAILLESEYYYFLQSGKRIINRIPIVGAEHLIPLKAKAWMDLSQRKAEGADVDSKDVKKHRNDVFRLFAIVDPEFAAEVPKQVRSDLSTFLNRMEVEEIALQSFGLGSQTLDQVLAELRRMYDLRHDESAAGT